MTNAKGSRIISRILPPAVRFWLATQLDQVENLDFRIEGRDRDILSGHIPEIALSAQRAIYQGIRLSQIAVTAQTIRINLGQVIRRQPLRLLAPFPVSGEALLTETDLNESLQSPLMGEGLYDFLQILARSQPEAAHLADILASLPNRTVLSHYAPAAQIVGDRLILRLFPKADQPVPEITLTTQLAIAQGHQLCLENPHWVVKNTPAISEAAVPLPDLHGFAIDLGSEVTLTECRIESQQLALAGTIRVLPEDT